MNELSPTKLNTDNTANVINYPKQMQGMGSVNKPHLGMTLYSVCHDTKEVEKVQLVESTLPVTNVPKSKMALAAQTAFISTEIHHKVTFSKKKWYGWAINPKNALKKYHKHMKAVNAFLNSNK